MVIYIALGFANGEVSIYHFNNVDNKLAAQGKGVDMGLSHLIFCGSSVLAAFNPDSEIFLLYVNHNKGLFVRDLSKVMKLGINCKGIKTKGLTPEDLRKRLESRAG